jgi:hypothetical protein
MSAAKRRWCRCGESAEKSNQTNGKPSRGLQRAVEKNTGLAAQQDVQFEFNRKKQSGNISGHKAFENRQKSLIIFLFRL